MNAPDTLHHSSAFNKFVAHALVIALFVIMCHEFRDGPSEMAFAERDHPVEAFLFDRTYEALRIGIRIRRLIRRPHEPNPGVSEPVSNWFAPLRVPVANQYWTPTLVGFVRIRAT
jgi:hypothetical protein